MVALYLTCLHYKQFKCIYKLCIVTYRNNFQANNISFKRPCYPGQVVNDRCRTCHCLTDSRWVCTDEACDEHEEINCKPGEKFQEDCNTCICHKSGSGASCTTLTCNRLIKFSHKTKVSED
ncbi:hypothetical protein Trydic_g13910 [Trypoxylus dichotomus]